MRNMEGFAAASAIGDSNPVPIARESTVRIAKANGRVQQLRLPFMPPRFGTRQNALQRTANQHRAVGPGILAQQVPQNNGKQIMTVDTPWQHQCLAIPSNASRSILRTKEHHRLGGVGQQKQCHRVKSSTHGRLRRCLRLCLGLRRQQQLPPANTPPGPCDAVFHHECPDCRRHKTALYQRALRSLDAAEHAVSDAWDAVDAANAVLQILNL